MENIKPYQAADPKNQENRWLIRLQYLASAAVQILL